MSCEDGEKPRTPKTNREVHYNREAMLGDPSVEHTYRLGRTARMNSAWRKNNPEHIPIFTREDADRILHKTEPVDNS